MRRRGPNWLLRLVEVGALTMALAACGRPTAAVPVTTQLNPPTTAITPNTGPTTPTTTPTTSTATGTPPTATGTPPTATGTPPTTIGTARAQPRAAVVRPCQLPDRTPPPIHGDAIDASRALLHAAVCSTSDIVVSAPGTATDDAVRAAIGMGAPLVFGSADHPFEPEPLKPERVWTTNPALVVDGAYSISPLPVPNGAVPALVASVVDSKVAKGAVHEVADTVRRSSTLAVLSTGRPDLAAPTATIARAVGGAAIWAPPGDFRARPVLSGPLQSSAGRFLIGNFDADSPWEADVAAAGTSLPGGGQILFPDKRIVTIYGSPATPNLGILGEQAPDEAVARAAEVARPYATEGVTSVPGFDLIAAIASSLPGADGNYSTEMTVDALKPWVDAATRAGYYLVLDLQPGRTDFLTMAQRYEDLLRLPNVGLALDPEWRLAPDQRHLRQTGSVDASEINEVVEWLAGIVRRDLLPQKLLVLHQFKSSMITDRRAIETPPELAVVIQMDGQGPLPAKMATWRNLLSGGEGDWNWGWKNFYDEDNPLATPDQVLGLDPVPVFVSFQ